ncbi:VOC family protein [Fredinandcohnia humi]
MNILEVTLQTTNLEKMKRFYIDLLHIPLIKENEESFTLSIGCSKLSFQKGKNESNYHFAINIPIEKIKEAQEWLSEKVNLLTEKGEQIILFPSPWNAQSLFFLDPTGNIVEFIGRERVHFESNEPFNSHSLLCLSEIGFPVTNPDEMKNEIRDLNLPIFRDFESFKAFGDDNGLFIVVHKAREWYMGNNIPIISPINVKISGAKTNRIEIKNHPYTIEVISEK